MPKFRTEKILLPTRAILAFKPRINIEALSFLRFLFGNGVGNTWRVLLYRFEDLSLLRPHFQSRNILEFGTGSSTLYFLNHGGQNCNVISYEQNLSYLPKYIFRKPNAHSVVSDVVVEHYQGFLGSRFLDSRVYCSSAVYLRGWSCFAF